MTKSLDPDAQLDEILAAYLLAEQAGHAPDRKAVLQAHPQHAVKLAAFFGDGDRLQLLAIPLQAVARAAQLAEPETPNSSQTVDHVSKVPGAKSQRASGAPPTVPGYEILGVLGRGGMGVVYKAHHVKLNRVVALKMILEGAHADKCQLERFRAEAEAVARLHHPNIVQIYEIDEIDGLPFFALEYCPGGSLSKKLDNTPQPPREAAKLVETLALAMEHAHVQKVVHRDLKPANILLAADGTIKVTDFGLAKQLDVPGFTQSNAVVGTPQYMAPEQAQGKSRELGPGVDVYALGAVLYQLLTGRPPFRGETKLETLLLVIEKDPVPPSSCQPGIPRDLENICLKCLEKDRRNRYASAGALAADLGRFLKGEPVEARPTSRLERALKWTRRYPARATVLGLGVLLMLVLVIGGGILALLQQGKSIAEDAKTVAEHAKKDQEVRSKAIQRSAYGDKIRQGLKLLQAGDTTKAKQQLEDCDWENRNLEWYQLKYRLEPDTVTLEGHTKPVAYVAFSPNGQFLASLDAGGVGILWNVQAGQKIAMLQGQIITHLAFSPDGQWLASAQRDGTLKLWDAHTGGGATSWLAHNSPVNDLAFAPDGMLASGANDGIVKLWNIGTHKEIRTLHGHRGAVRRVAISPDGQWLASGSADNSIRVWDVKTGAAKATLTGHETAVTQLAWSPDSTHLASAGNDWSLELWDAVAGKKVASLKGHQDIVTRLQFSPDGRQLASASADKLVKQWDAATGAENRGLKPLAGGVKFMAYSPDGVRLATACADGTVALWYPVTGREIATLTRHQGGASCVAFSADGQWLASAGSDSTVKLCNPTSTKQVARLTGHRGEVHSVAYSSDGRHVASACPVTVLVWDALTGKQLAKLPIQKKGEGVTHIAFSPDGGVLAWAVADGKSDTSIRLWSVATAQEICRLPKHFGPVTHIAFSPNGQLLASSSQDSTIKLHTTRTGAAIALLTGHRGAVTHVAFSPDGQVLASAGKDNAVKLWDVETHKEIATLEGHTFPVAHLAFSPDGMQLASASWDKTVILWDRRTLRKVAVLTGHTAHVLKVVYSTAHDSVLASASSDGSVKLWNTQRRQEIATLSGHSAEVDHVAFSPDGERLASAGRDGTVILWDAETHKELITLTDAAKAPVRHLAFRPDGQQLATASADGIVRLWYGKMADGVWEQRKKLGGQR